MHRDRAGRGIRGLAPLWDAEPGRRRAAAGLPDLPEAVSRPPPAQAPGNGLHGHTGPGYGTLGYGAPGIQPGFQGFGLGYHRGYGYGGDALGVGAEGGYPQYGGPGYPHPWPTLRRIGGINPFYFYGGPGGPTPDCPIYYAGPSARSRPMSRWSRSRMAPEPPPGTTAPSTG